MSEQNTLSSSGKNGLLLGAFALSTTLLIAAVNWLTAPEIERQIRLKTQKIINEIQPQSSYDNDITADCLLVDSALIGSNKRVFRARQQDEAVALVLEATTPNGYSGNIDFILSYDLTTQQIGGVRILSHQETPGLGDKIELRISNWILGFTGLTYADTQESGWAVKKDGGRFDQFTGATITPRAVVEGVQQTISYIEDNRAMLTGSSPNCPVKES
ncbi:MAG: electron transport complex subunit RsxG [Alteromonadaceae bacterium]|nr:electron transport complex subunit RsxG [Alteromonadaceae bacterium]